MNPNARIQTIQLPMIKHIVLVASGKGGVGKSSIAAMLAAELASQDLAIGILDADIYGPSQAVMQGIQHKRPEAHASGSLTPIQANGVHVVSMGNLVTDKTPMVWRGPMASGALQQLLSNTAWPELDYLIVDMPPGTGDIQLTVAQSLEVSAAIVVTTPQDIALLDVKKAVSMFEKVKIPIAGIVENMAMHTCSKCGHQEAIFGEGGADSIAAELGTQVLGRIPLNLNIRASMDDGHPAELLKDNGELKEIFERIATSLHSYVSEGDGEHLPFKQID